MQWLKHRGGRPDISQLKSGKRHHAEIRSGLHVSLARSWKAAGNDGN